MKSPLLLAFLASLAVLVVPRTVAGRGADVWLANDLATEDALARTVIEGVTAQRGDIAYRTGELRFDGQATVAIHQMALLGLGQIVLAHPEKKDAYLPAMRLAARHLATPATLAYASKVYGHSGLERMGPGEGHAYLGYINLGLSMLRRIDPHADIAALNDRLTDALARNIDASPNGLIETYPGETWPPDVAAVIGSIGLHAQATGTDRRALLERWAKRFERCTVHVPTGLLVQRLDPGACDPADAPRGSGTAIAAYFLSFATPELARRLYDGLARSAWRSIDGFGGFREYPDGFHGDGDVDAGPIVLGVSVGATGFGLGAAKVHGDRDRFVGLWRSTKLFGVPTSVGDRTAFAPGGVLGNALLLAMLTAGPR